MAVSGTWVVQCTQAWPFTPAEAPSWYDPASWDAPQWRRYVVQELLPGAGLSLALAATSLVLGVTALVW